MLVFTLAAVGFGLLLYRYFSRVLRGDAAAFTPEYRRAGLSDRFSVLEYINARCGLEQVGCPLVPDVHPASRRNRAVCPVLPVHALG